MDDDANDSNDANDDANDANGDDESGWAAGFFFPESVSPTCYPT